MRKLLLLPALVSCSQITFAQTDPLWTMFQQNLIFHNATLTGTDSTYARTLHLHNRNQWPEIKGGGYRTLQLAYMQKLKKSNATLGGYYLHDNAGGLNLNDRVGILYHYNLKLSSKTALRFGLNAYYLHQYLNVTKLIPPLTFPIKNNLHSYGIFPGISLYRGNFYIGISENVIQVKSFVSNTGNLRRIFYWNMGTRINLGKTFSLSPSFVYTLENKTDLTQINLTFSIKNKLETGVTARFPSNMSSYTAYCLNMGLTFFKQKFSLYYSYDLPQQTPIYVTFTSHEMALKFRF
ncbi:MAG: PorP/SprF family type IX secretion system membrane protein [Bacteroidia bacterium]|nr:PorP/SprF family type IX secretion system membrane protein [Bacteroidia bacterium]